MTNINEVNEVVDLMGAFYCKVDEESGKPFNIFYIKYYNEKDFILIDSVKKWRDFLNKFGISYEAADNIVCHNMGVHAIDKYVYDLLAFFIKKEFKLNSRFERMGIQMIGDQND